MPGGVGNDRMDNRWSGCFIRRYKPCRDQKKVEDNNGTKDIKNNRGKTVVFYVKVIYSERRYSFA